MRRKLVIGDHVTWNSEAGRVRGTIKKKITTEIQFKGYTACASKEEPQYLIKSDTTDHLAMHKGSALKRLRKAQRRGSAATRQTNLKKSPRFDRRPLPKQPGICIPIRIRFSTVFPVVAIVGVPLLAAYAQWALLGLPPVRTSPHSIPDATQAYGFAAWIRITHYVNLLFMVLLVRSGLQILMDHPRLYWNVHCTPGSEWIRFTPVDVPTDRLYTAKEDARYLTPWVGCPCGRHTLGLAPALALCQSRCSG